MTAYLSVMEVPDPKPTLVYVASALANEIAVFALRRDAARLELVQTVSIPSGVTPLTVSPDRRIMYAGFRAQPPSIVGLAIDPQTGHLRLLASTLLPDPPMYIATDVSGRFLLSASYANDAFTISSIRRDGSVASDTIQRSQTPSHPHCIVADPTNRFVFVTSLGGDVILQFTFDAATGRALPNTVPFIRTETGSGPRHMVFHPKNGTLYVNGELDGSIASFAVSLDTGRLSALGHVQLQSDFGGNAPWSAELAVSPNGRYLYASERRMSTLTIFDVDGEPGALQRREIVATEEQPRSFAIDPRGGFLVVAGEKSNHITAYRIDHTTGALGACERYPVGAKPCWVQFVELLPQAAPHFADM